MPYLKIIGVGERKEGDFNNNHYDFRMFYGKNENGQWTHYKVRTKLLNELGFIDPTVLEGNEVDIYGSSTNVSYLKIHG